MRLRSRNNSHRLEPSFEKNEAFNFEIYSNKVKGYMIGYEGFFSRTAY